MRCFYDTSYTNRTTIGGFGFDQEMCKTFVAYYNLLPEYPICRSELISPTYLVRYFAGTTNITWDQSRLEFAATTALPHLAGMALTEISDSRFVNWDSQLRSELQRDHIFHPQVEICASTREGNSQQPTFVTVPASEATEQSSPRRCGA